MIVFKIINYRIAVTKLLKNNFFRLIKAKTLYFQIYIKTYLVINMQYFQFIFLS